MRDLIDARLWADHHQAFDDFVIRAAYAIRSGLHRLALVLAFAITALTFNATTTTSA